MTHPTVAAGTVFATVDAVLANRAGLSTDWTLKKKKNNQQKKQSIKMTAFLLWSAPGWTLTLFLLYQTHIHCWRHKSITPVQTKGELSFKCFYQRMTLQSGFIFPAVDGKAQSTLLYWVRQFLNTVVTKLSITLLFIGPVLVSVHALCILMASERSWQVYCVLTKINVCTGSHVPMFFVFSNHNTSPSRHPNQLSLRTAALRDSLNTTMSCLSCSSGRNNRRISIYV